MFIYCKNCTFWRAWREGRAVLADDGTTDAFCYRNSLVSEWVERDAGSGCGDGEPRGEAVPFVRLDAVERAVRGNLACMDAFDDAPPAALEQAVRAIVETARSLNDIDESQWRQEQRARSTADSGIDPCRLQCFEDTDPALYKKIGACNYVRYHVSS